MKSEQKIYNSKDTERLLDGTPREYVLKIKDMPVHEQPREKLMQQGPAALTLQELLSVILNSGTKQEGVAEMSNRIVREYGERSIFSEKNARKLGQELGISAIKACQIVACGEVGRRIYEKNASGFVVLRTAKDVHAYVKDMHNLPKEHLRGLYVNSHNRIIHDEIISIGTVSTSIVHSREVFRPAIEYNAAAVILAHNHPSGSVQPSEQDREVTEQLIQAGKIIGIHVLDHVVVARDNYESVQAHY